jgi:hypothetical protein
MAEHGDTTRCQIRFDEATPDVSFYVQKEGVSDAPRAFVYLRLAGYKIEVKHVTLLADGSRKTDPLQHLIFESDGIKDVWLKFAGKRIELEKAAKDVILRRVLFGKP